MKLGMIRNDILLITGSEGFIGKHLSHRIKDLGCKVILLDKIKPKNFSFGHRINFIQCDITKKDELKKLKNIKGRIILIHLAACVPLIPDKEDKALDSIFEVNIKATINILNNFQNRLSKVYYVSTLEVYGVPIYLPIDEKHPTNPTSFYGISKLSAEHYLRIFCRCNRIPFAVLRLSCVYGPGENYDRAIPNFIKSAIKNEPIMIYGDGLDTRDYLYVDDAINALLLSIREKSAQGVFNIASSKGYKIRDIAKTIIKLCNSRSKINFYKRRKKFYNLFFNISKAKEKIKFLPKTTIEEGLLKEIAWFRWKNRLR